MFRIKNELEELGSPLSDLQMVDMLLRSLPTQVCYNELRRKVIFSSNMSKYTPALVREMILTAETRSKDWEKNAFGNNQAKKKQSSASAGQKGSHNKNDGDTSRKKTPRTDVECYNYGGKGHYKSDCPDLEEKPSARRNAQAKMARSGEKPMKTTVSEQTGKSNHTNKRDVVVGEVVKRVARDYDSGCWYFDSGTNTHIVVSKEYFTVLNSMEDSDWNPSISGFADDVDAQAEGFGTILLATMIDQDMVVVFVEDVLYVPKAGCNLFSPGQALVQGFKMSWDQEAMMFGMTKDDTEVIRAMYQHRLWTFDVHNIGDVKVSKKTIVSKRQVVASFAVTDGVEDIDVWHARLGHTCPEYIRLIVDRRMAKGIMLKKRGKIDCADSHFGKQRRKTYQNKLVRNIEKANDIVFADMLIPGLSNSKAYSAVLVVMDGYSRFMTTYLLKSRNEVK
ncbi:hypothetical protein PI124_g19278 [Phytophthora idaei]|nr:hypothetical protein PI124_g19278 [Phytophthora idaei]